MARVSKMKTQTKRSAMYHLISPINHLLDAKVDLWGSAIVISIMISAVFLMRTLLSATH